MEWLTTSLRNKILTLLVLSFGTILTAGLVGTRAGLVGLETFDNLNRTVIRQSTEVLHTEAEFKEQVQEWKNVLIRAHDQKSLDDRWGKFTKQEKQVRDAAARLAGEIRIPEVRDLMGKFVRAHEEMGRKYAIGKDRFVEARFEVKAGDAAVKGIDREPTELLAKAAEMMREHATKETNESLVQARRNLVISLILMGIVSLVAMLLSWRIVISSITRPIGEALGFVRSIAKGDLSQTVSTSSRDEIGQMIIAMGEMNGNLKQIVKDVRESAMTVASGSSEITSGSNNLSQRTEEQASSLEETASSMEEMTSTVKQNADNAARANQMAEAARAEAEKGGQVVDRTVMAMDEITASSRKIADIISTIDGIAFQTNLLALNAAVEAARAGEQGRGFAVVATEVRNLAQRSANAAKEIKTLIEDSVAKVGMGSKLVEESGATLNGIVTSVKKVSDVVADIAAASHEQSSGIDQVNQAVVQMDEMTQQNAALVEEAAAAARSLEEQAQLLNQMMEFFRLGDENKSMMGMRMSASAASAPAAHLVKSGDHVNMLKGVAPTARARVKAPIAPPVAKGAPATKAPQPNGNGSDHGQWEKF